MSGGNMANFVGFLAARAAKAGGEVRRGRPGLAKPLCCYCFSRDPHVDSEGRRHVRPRNRFGPVDSVR